MLEENAAERDRRDRLRFMNEVGVKPLGDHLLHEAVDRVILRIVFGEMTDGSFQLGAEGNLRGVAWKFKHGKTSEVSEIGARHTGRPIRIVVGYVVPIDFQLATPTVLPGRQYGRLRQMNPPRRGGFCRKAEPRPGVFDG